MHTTTSKLLTIYTEAALESSLIREIDKLGATGYTITNARGRGNSGSRTASWEANANIRVEIMCAPTIALNIMQTLNDKFASNYALAMYTSDIQVAEENK